MPRKSMHIMSTVWAFSTENIRICSRCIHGRCRSHYCRCKLRRVCVCVVPFTPIFDFPFSWCVAFFDALNMYVLFLSLCMSVYVCMLYNVALLADCLSLSLTLPASIYSDRGSRCDYISPFLYVAAVAALLLFTVVCFFIFAHFTQYCSPHTQQ